MATLPELAFAFARFVARECRPARRTFGPVAARRRWNSGRRHQRRPDRHGGLRHRRAPYCVHRRHRRGNHWTQRRVQTPVAAAEPAVVAVPEVAAEEAVGALNEDEASASNAFVDADELLKSEWLIDDPEHDFGYNPAPEFSSPPDAIQPGAEMQEVGVAAPAPAAPVPRAQAEENEDAALIDIPTPSPEARVLLRTFTSAMAASPAEIHAGTWSPALLGLTNRLEGLRLDDPSEGTNRR